MTFELLCMGVIALGFGLLVTFAGYKLLWIILPIWGFVAGFAIGAQAIQAIFDEAFLATVTSWVVGFVVGGFFAVFSYLFYFIAVALLAGGFGYGVAVGLLTWIGLDFGLVVWLLGIVAGAITAAVVLALNLQKYAVIVITAVGGTATIIYTLLAAFGGLPPGGMLANPVQTAIDDSWLWFLFFVVVAGAGIYFQLVTNRYYVAEDYDRWASP
ncbi:MAG: DUF4203 domain-containing protein [Planctomycetales bacterium]|nr:DUF4203 domain-containing protein [Planctomycetales bacterium]